MKVKKVKLGDICNIVSGSTPSTNIPEYWDGEYNWVAPNELNEDTKYIFSTNKKITKLAIEKAGLKLLPVGTVLLSSRAPIGKVAIAGSSMYCNQGFKNLICSDKIYNEFLYWYLVSKKEYLNSIGRGATFKELSKTLVESVIVPLPDLHDQRRIATILDKADAICRKRKECIKILDELVKARFVEMFGDPITNPLCWEKNKLGELGELNRGVSKYRPRNAPELLNGKYPLIQTGDVAASDIYITKYNSSYSDFGLKQSKIWPAGTLCITIAANIAKTAILTFDSCFPDSIVGFISGQFTNNIYIHVWFTFFQKIIEEQAPESAQKNINLKILNELYVTTPPITLQNKFYSYVQKIKNIKSTMQAQLQEAETLKAALIQQYFSQPSQEKICA